MILGTKHAPMNEYYAIFKEGETDPIAMLSTKAQAKEVMVTLKGDYQLKRIVIYKYNLLD